MKVVSHSSDLFRAHFARKTEPCAAVLLMALALLPGGSVTASPTGPVPDNQTKSVPANQAAAQQDLPTFYIREYRVEGARQLKRIEVEEAVYPFLGPGRTAKDVEQARAALEKAYQDKGYQTVSVEVPAQTASGGVVLLQVTENSVGRLRVHGSRYYSLDRIKKAAPSMAPGSVPNFNEITRDIVALNQLPGRRVTPSLSRGVQPGTVDIDLKVEDTFPLHGSLELNNRYSADTTPLRLNGSLSYCNLWQLGHSIGGSFQVSPADISEVKVYSGYYLARFPSLPEFSLMLQGTKQDSNVSTLGGAAVAGRGEMFGPIAMFNLPSGKDFFHSLNVGFSYKHYLQNVVIGTSLTETPITYYPVSLNYNATWASQGPAKGVTGLDAGVTFNIRGIGSNVAEFDLNRYRALGSFIYFRGALSRTQPLPFGMEGFAKVEGQIANQPLPNSEQFSAGGLGTVPGYLESTVLGDNAFAGLVELRSPSVTKLFGDKIVNEWRFHLFAAGAWVSIREPLPEQISSYSLASLGVGSSMQLWRHLNGTVDAGFPLITENLTSVSDYLVTFRVWGDF